MNTSKQKNIQKKCHTSKKKDKSGFLYAVYKTLQKHIVEDGA